MGRFCLVCVSIRPNEAFGGKGRRARICRRCHRMPREKQDTLLQEREIHGFLEQSRISEKNIARLQVLARSKQHAVAELASLVADIAQAAPYRRRRIKTLARERRDILKRMEIAGLLLPLAADPRSRRHRPECLVAGMGEFGFARH